MLRKIRIALLSASLTVSVSQAGVLDVLDSDNLVQNTLVAENTAQSLLNEAEMIAQQLEMIENQAKNLTTLPYSVVSRIAWNVSRLENLVNDTLGLSMDYRDILDQFGEVYPGWGAYQQDSSYDYMARTYWWQEQTRLSIKDAMRSQGLVADIEDDKINLEGMVSASDSSIGALQALQAGNSITGLMVDQLLGLRQIIASSHRQQSTFLAHQMANEEMDVVRMQKQTEDWTESSQGDVMSEDEYLRFIK